MKPTQRFSLICLLLAFSVLSAPAQSTSQNAKEAKKEETEKSSSGLRKIKTNRGVDQMNEQIEKEVNVNVNQILETVAVELKQLDIHLNAMEVDLGNLDIEMEPLEIEIPEIDIDMEDIEIEIPEMDIDIHIDMDENDFHMDRDDEDEENEEEALRSKGLKKLTADDTKEKAKDKEKSKSDKPADKDKSKGLKKIN